MRHQLRRGEMERKYEFDFDCKLDSIIAKNKPVIRIKKIELTNFKSIGERIVNSADGSTNIEIQPGGEIEFRCKNNHIDILGIYGQNGSGKSAVIEALAIVKALMSGEPLPKEYFYFIAFGKRYAKLKFIFEIKIKYPNKQKEVVHEVIYSFCMGRKRRLIPEDPDTSDDYEFMIFNEKFFSKGNNVDIDASRRDFPDAANPLVSSVFAIDLLQRLDVNSIKFEILGEFRRYAKDCLYVVTAKSLESNSTTATPIYFKKRTIIFDDCKPTKIPVTIFDEVKYEVNKISCVLEKMAPGLFRPLRLRELNNPEDKDELDTILEFFIDARIKPMPLKCESNNVKRIISIVPLIIEVFNQPSVTVAIDDFDQGIFEYLFGKILEVLAYEPDKESDDESAKGQFVFTAHNLRPVEKLANTKFHGDKRFLYFTTTNPENKYVHPQNIVENNNLRDIYLNEIDKKESKQEGNSDEKLKRKRKFEESIELAYKIDMEKIRKALTEAGHKE